MTKQHQRLPEQRWHVHVCQHHQHLLRRRSTFAGAVVARTCVSAASTFAAMDINVCKSSGGISYFSNTNVFCSNADTSRSVVPTPSVVVPACRALASTLSAAVPSHQQHQHFPRTRRHLAASGFHTTTATRAGTMGNCGSTACYPIVCMQQQCCMFPCLHTAALPHTLIATVL